MQLLTSYNNLAMPIFDKSPEGAVWNPLGKPKKAVFL
jgi:hypothetical protein